MKRDELVKIQLKNDLIKELGDRYNLTTISKEKYLNLCETKIDLKIKDLLFLDQS